MTDNLPAIQDENFTSKFLGALIEGVTGALVADRKDYVLTASHIFQGALNRNFIQSVKAEWDSYKEKGRIKDDYEQTEQHHACLKEMLDFLDQDGPDKVRFEFMKKIFLMAATEEVQDRESLLPQQYINLCRKLISGDVIVLLTVYKVSRSNWEGNQGKNLRVWLDKIKNESGLKDRELVEVYEKNLIRYKLLTPRYDQSGKVNPDGHKIMEYNNCRLTDLAVNICKYIEAYDAIKKQR